MLRKRFVFSYYLMAKRKTPKQKLVLEDAAEKFISTATQAFSTDKAITWMKPRLIAPPTRIQEAVDRLLQNNKALFFDCEQGLYSLRRTFFHAGKFLVSPTADEIRDGILFPGHRFMPFVSRDVFPAACRLKLPGKKTVTCKCKAVSRQLNDILIYFSMFGVNGILEYLLTDHESNSRSLSQGPESKIPVEVTVFNMKTVYKQFAFQPGDALLLTVDDWTDGCFSVAHVPHSDLEAREFQRKVWCRNLDKALLEVFDSHRGTMDIDEQLAQAFFASSEPLLESPQIHIGGYLAASEAVEMAATPTGTVLWRKGESPVEELFSDYEPADNEMVGRRDSLAAILNDVGLSLSESEIDAYMRDELFSGKGDPDAVLERCLRGRGFLDYADEAQEKAFMRFYRKLWQHVKKTYIPTEDGVKGPLRAHALSIIDKHLRWMRNCDQAGLMPADLPSQETLELAVKSGVLSNLIEALRPDDTDLDYLDVLPGLLLEIESDVDSLIASASGASAHGSRSRFRVLEGGKAAFDNVYQLKVSLQGIRPPIWRRIQVPETITLGELHIILQAAMGWQVAHLHQFTFGDTSFGSADVDDFGEMGYDDEAGVPLASLLSKKGEAFSYEYDFGDSWVHTIKVEKTVPAESGSVYPRCTTGRRACPPEDCGGIWGYEDLLAALKDPDHEDHEESLGWVGDDFDPDAFDVELTNTRIAHYDHDFK